jgi:hypothetical protein
MKCAEVTEMLSAYADGEIGGRRAAELRVHIAQCDSCRAQLEALGALQSRLTEMMGEPMEATDVSDLVMASLPARTTPRPVRWGWVGAAACLLILLGAWLMLSPRQNQQMAKHVPKAPPRVHVSPKRSVPGGSAPVIVQAPEKTPARPRHVVRRIVLIPTRHPRHRPLPARQQPIQRPDPLETPRLVVASRTVDGRVETTVAVNFRSLTLSQVKTTVINLPPNEDAATARPALEVIENSPAATMGQYGG